MDFKIDSKLRILAIAPNEAIKLALLRAAEAYPDIELDAYTGDLQEGVAIVQSLPHEDYDAVISRGGTADLIRPTTKLPVVSIPISVYDVLRTIKLSENFTDSSAIVGFPSVTENAHILCDLLRKEIQIITVNSPESVQTALQQLSAEGVRTVICDIVTHRIARSMGMNALLITSGEASLHEALQEIRENASTFRRIRSENHFMRKIMQMDSRQSLVLNEKKDIVFTFSTEVPKELIALIRRKIPLLRENEESLFYQQLGNEMHIIQGSTFYLQNKQYYLFRDTTSQSLLRSTHYGIRSFNADECEQLFMNSIFSVSGTLGNLDQRISLVAASEQPIMILG